MTKWALVQDTRICEFVKTKKECFPVAESLQWVEVPDNTTTDHQYVDDEVVHFGLPNREGLAK